MSVVMRLKIKEHRKCVEEHQCPTVAKAMSNTPCRLSANHAINSRSLTHTQLCLFFSHPCSGGRAGEYECSNVDLLAFVPLRELGSNGDGNDIWGWTDPETDQEYAIMGCQDGTSFVDVTDPTNPLVIAFLPTHTSSSLWRDLKVIKNTPTK